MKKVLLAALLMVVVTGMVSSASAAAITILNPSFEDDVFSGYSGPNPPASWSKISNGMITADATALSPWDGNYVNDTNGLDGEQLVWYTAGGINGYGLAQTLGVTAQDNTIYTLTVGVGDRFFASRYAGMTLELRLADDSVLGTQLFDTPDVAPLFVSTVSTGEVVDVTASFTLGDVDNTQNLRIAVIAGGATSAVNGGTAYGQSLDFDNVRLNAALAPEILYRETFANTLPGDHPTKYAMDPAGWQAHHGPAATLVSGPVGDEPVLLFNGTGAAALEPVNSNCPEGVTPLGRTWHADVVGGEPHLFWTDEHTISDQSDIDMVSWEQQLTGTDVAPSVAVCIDGDWYMSNESGTKILDSDWDLLELDFGAATWSSVSFTPGSELVIGGAASLPAGAVDAFGLIIPEFPDGAYLRYDNYTISGVPEPSALVLLCVASGMLLGSYRRRRMA